MPGQLPPRPADRPKRDRRIAPPPVVEQKPVFTGPPRQITPNKRMKTTEWEYPWLEAAKEKRIFWVSFSGEGVVVKVVEMHDEEAEPTSD